MHRKLYDSVYPPYGLTCRHAECHVCAMAMQSFLVPQLQNEKFGKIPRAIQNRNHSNHNR